MDISVSAKLGIYLFDLLKIHPSLRVSGCAYKILRSDSNQQLKFPIRSMKYPPKPPNMESSKSRRIGLLPFLQGQQAGRLVTRNGRECQTELASCEPSVCSLNLSFKGHWPSICQTHHKKHKQTDLYFIPTLSLKPVQIEYFG